MFDVTFYLGLVNEEFKSSLAKPITESDLTTQGPRVLVRLEQYFAANPLKGGATFNHFRPARYFAEMGGTLRPQIAEETLKRFEKAFKKLNGLL